MRRNTVLVLGLALLLLLALGAFVVTSTDVGPAPAVEEAGADPEAPEGSNGTKRRVHRRDGSRSGKRDERDDGERPDDSGSPEGTDSGSTSTGGRSGSKPEDGEDGEDAGTTEPPSPEEGKPGAPPPHGHNDRDLPPKRVGGVVLDANTGEPVAGARVLYAIVDDKGAGGWFGGKTDEKGRFSAGGWKPEQLRGGTPEIRIRAEGYRTYIAPVGDATVEVRLEVRDLPPLPGAVEGNVLGPDAQPHHGRIAMVGYDDFGNNMHQWTTTDERGEFRLESMPPGRWRLAPYGSALQNLVIPEDSAVRVSFELASAPRDSETLSADTRAVSVEAPADLAAGAAVRAELRARHFWRATVRDGRASFPHLPIGTWTFVLEQPGQAELKVTAVVAAGDGAQTVELR